MSGNNTTSTGPFPPQASTTPFWRSELHELDDHQSTPFPETADILIVGGGYAGIAAAYHLLCDVETKVDPPPNVVLLEARGACSGATGRNGGHLRPSVYTHLLKLIEDYNEKDAIALADFEFAHVQAIADLVEREKIDCDFKITKSFDIHTDVAAASKAKNDFLELKRMGMAKSTIDDLTWYDAEEAEEISGVKGTTGCFQFTAAQIWPYKLFMHLLARCLSTGALNLQTHTPATSISPSSSSSPNSHWIVTTPRGNIAPKTLIIATNGFAHTLLPEYKSKIHPARGICSHITTPSLLTAPKLHNSYCLRLPHKSHDYLIQLPDNSIIVGGARSAFLADRTQWLNNTDDSTLISPARHYFDTYMQTHFHGWEESGAEVESIWTGLMGYVSDSLPHVGEVPGRKGCFVAAGWEGHGMPVIWLAMRGVALMVGRGVSWEESGIPNLYRTTRERLESRKDDYAVEVPVVEKAVEVREREMPKLYMSTLESFGNEINNYLAAVSAVGTRD